jgi:16S rRNA (cytidine1402-2'-O)-methyltransferase
VNLKPGLYIVSTPIGNLGDITLRALDVLSGSDVIFCEDTRVSSKLLAKHSIKAPLKVYNDNSDETQRYYIKSLVEGGKIVSLISDAGTPLISDPGYKLVREFKEEGVHVDVIPGACAVIAALSISGLATNRFMFAGFLSKTKEGKAKIFEEISSLDATVVFYETANRLMQSLEVAKEILGDREVNVARVLTKLYQESKSAPLSELIEYYTQNPARGEIVISISGKGNQIITEDILKSELQALLSSGASAKSASDAVFAKYKSQYSRKEIYKLANGLKS